MIDRKRRILFYGVLFLANAVGMILELAASRVISPYYGTSNYVWTAVIGIILLSGSAGNLAGGLITRRTGQTARSGGTETAGGTESPRRTGLTGWLSRLDSAGWLVLLLALAAVLTALIAVVGPAALTALKRSGLRVRVASVAASILLFFLPSAILGTVTPVLMQEMLAGRDDVGLETGKIHAVIAVGSLFGTFAGGFWLIPVMGTKLILNVLAAVLLALALVMCPRAEWKALFPVGVCAAAVLLCVMYTLRVNKQAETTVGDLLEDGISIDTQYGRILIQDGVYNGHPVRYYRQSGAYSSASYLEENLKYEIVYDYVAAYNRMLDLVPQLRRTLMIGGAAYQYPKYYISHFPDKSMDVVEIDGEATEIARKYFFLGDLIEEYQTEENGRLNLITEDGRVFLSETQETYDAILNDAFSGETPVGVLATVEAVRSIKNHLNPGGVYMSNILGIVHGRENRFIRSELQTMAQVFRYVYVIPCVEGTNGSQYTNYMAVASDEELDIPDDIQVLYLPDDIILTDDYCPIEQLVVPYFH